MKLTGFHSENERFLVQFSQDVNFDLEGILLAGILIGAVGQSWM